MNKAKTLFSAFCILLILLFCSCTNQTGGDSELINISVTIAPEKEFVSRIAGDKAAVNVIVPTGANPENYDPTIADIKAFSDADIYFTIGVPTEENSILPMLDEGTAVIQLEKSVRSEIPDLYIGTERDPHIWLSVERVKIMARAICTALSDADPENAEYYGANTEAYIAELDGAKAYADELLSDLTNRSIIVYHPAFGYFADEHSLTMHALENEGKEATAKELAALIDYAREQGITTVFYQEESSGKQAEAFASEIGGKAVMLSPLSENYIESYRLTAEKIKESAK